MWYSTILQFCDVFNVYVSHYSISFMISNPCMAFKSIAIKNTFCPGKFTESFLHNSFGKDFVLYVAVQMHLYIVNWNVVHCIKHKVNRNVESVQLVENREAGKPRVPGKR